jgi:hypothetical protein
MTTQYTSILKLALPVQGELSGTWGDTVNDNITSMVEEAIAGRSVINSWTANSHTLTTADGTTSESRAAMLEFTDTGTALTGNATVVCPTASKIYIAKNAVGGSRTVTLKTSSGTGIAIPDGTTMFLFCDGTNVVEAVTNINSFNVGGTVAINAIKDEDDMLSDSATALATQQSIKAYVDSQVGSFDTLAEVLAQGNTTGGTDILITSGDAIGAPDASGTDQAGTAVTVKGGAGTGTGAGGSLVFQTAPAGSTGSSVNAQVTALTIDSAGDATFTGASYNMSWDKSADSLTFADNAKAVFGAGSDLQIYHDASHSFIKDAGTGHLKIQATNLKLQDVDGNNYIDCIDGSYVRLMHDGSTKLETTSTGIDVTGTAVTDGLTVDGSATLTRSDTNTILTLESTDASATSAPRMDFYRNSASPADDDGIALIRFRGQNGAASTISYSSLAIDALDITGATEDAGMQWSFQKAGTIRELISIESTGTVFNQEGVDHDFRVESNSNTNALFVDAGNDRVGIGTASPSTALTISGAFDATSAGSKPSITGTGNYGGGIGFIDTNVSGIYTDTSGANLKFFTNQSGSDAAQSNVRLTIDGSGNVGIGTASPVSPLTTSIGAGSAGSLNNQIAMTHTGASNSYHIKTIRASANDEPAGLAFVENTTERMRIDSSGNVLIGTTSGSRNLVVKGSASGSIGIDGAATGNQQIEFAQAGTAKAYLTYWDSSDTLALTDGSANGLHFSPSTGNVGIGTSSPGVRLHVEGATNSNVMIVNNIGTAPNYIFDVRDDGVSKFRVDPSGNVGIGETSPLGKLHIKGADTGATASAQGNSLVIEDSENGLSILSSSSGAGYINFGDSDDNNVGMVIYDHSSNSMRFWINASEAARLDASGNFGIGTSPAAGNTLDISSGDGTIRVTQELDVATAGLNLIGASNQGTLGRITIWQNATSAQGGYIKFDTCPTGTNTLTERMRIDSSGNVGIGTTSPSAKLDIFDSGAGNANSSAIELTNYDYGVGETGQSVSIEALVRNDGGGSSTTGKIVFGKDSDYSSAANRDGNIQFYTNQSNSVTEAMRIDSSGRVGIGRTNPSSYVTDANSLYVKGQIRVDGVTNTAAVPSLTLNDTNSGLFAPAANEIAISTGAAERMRIDSSGRVGIARTPSISNSKLEVGGADDVPLINVEASGNTGGIGIGSTGLQFFHGSSAKMRIGSNGDVFFNTTTVADLTKNAFTFDQSSGRVVITTNNNTEPMILNRQDNDGVLVEFRQASVVEGTISVSGTTVSYNGGHLSRWSQLIDNSKDTSIVKGTVMTNLDDMCEWAGEDNEQLNKMAVSSVEGDTNVAGVFVNWDEDDPDYDDMNVAMTGDMVIRIAQGTTVARGDLLMSAGDGTAKPQDDDIVRSKTIAKVTSTHVSHTYSDGSYLVPCVLMAC